MKKTVSRKSTKATKSRQAKKPKEITFSLTVEAQKMRVNYDPSFGSGTGHFEFRSPHTPPRRIPVSETGYRSAFVPLDEIAAAPNLEDYAHQLALAIMREKQRPQRQSESSADQLSLF